MAHLTAKGREYHEAITTLDSERAANATLTSDAEHLYDVLDRLVHQLMEDRDFPLEHKFSPLGSALATLHDLQQHAMPRCVCAVTYAKPGE
ncbi:hypothetical protein K7W03_14535 [Sphingobium sp. PNB]|uniref:hypothetical protein n=1 Tax=Sphingobium sp. PNB TaxID=863934 RepID=UPI001CA3F20C|nr:hypothetical protein [Sphingobium sp. PNB]MCB4860809.1 hypothetical protein [Sphingobium sp. PNB]